MIRFLSPKDLETSVSNLGSSGIVEVTWFDITWLKAKFIDSS